MSHGPMPAVAKVFETVSTATVSKSAAQAKEMLFLRPEDGITMNCDRLLHDAKQKALSLVDGYTAPEAPHRSEEHTSELQSLMRISYAVFCLKKKNTKTNTH